MSKKQLNVNENLNNGDSKVISIWGLPGSGKSTFAAQTAALLAEQTGARVLLADFDILHPALDHYMGVSKEPEGVSYNLNDAEGQLPNTGLAYAYDSIERGTFNQKILKEIVISKPKSENLDILTGNYSLNMFEMLTEKHFDTIIEVAKKAYDYIIIDTNGVLFIDATFTALRKSDTVYVVSEGDYTQLREVNKGIDYLSSYVPKEKYKVIINKYTRKHLDKATIGQVLQGIEVAQIIDYSEKYIKSKLDKKLFVSGCGKGEKRPYLDVVKEITQGSNSNICRDDSASRPGLPIG